MSRTFVYLTALLVLPLLPMTAAAQDTAAIEGIVYSAEDDQPLPGAQIRLEGTDRGTVSDVDGAFLIDRIEPGTYDVVVQFVGYETQTLSVDLQAGVTETLEITLHEGAIQLDDIVVTALGEGQLRSDVAATIASIDRARIEEINPAHPSELMGSISGVWVNQTSGEGHMTAIRQPLTVNPVFLFMENGIPSRSTGFFNHNALFEINVPQAENVEVIKGPGTALHGSDAIGGVINVQTRSAPLTPELRTVVEGGSFGYRRALVSGGARFGNHGLTMDLNLSESDGWRDASAFDRQSGTLNWEADLPGASSLTTVASFSLVSQNPAGSTPLSEEQFETEPKVNTAPIAFRDVTAVRVSSTYEHNMSNSQLRITPYGRFNEMDMLPDWALSFDPHISETQNFSFGVQGRYRHNIQPMDGRIVAGINAEISPGERQEYRIDPSSSDGVFTSFTQEEAIYDYDVTFREAAPYLQTTFSPVERLNLSGGVRANVLGYDYTNNLDVVSEGPHRRAASTTRTFSRLTPNAGITYEFASALNMFFSYRQAFRVPSESQLFRQGSTSNTLDLEPVVADNFEVGFRGTRGANLDYEASVYLMNKRNDILRFTDTEGRRISTNAGRTTHRGVELSLGYRPLPQLELQSAFSYAVHRFEDWQPRPNLDLSGNEMDIAPNTMGNLTATYLPGWFEGARLSLEWSHLGSYYMDPENTTRYPGHDLLNLRAQIPLVEGFSFTGHLTNLTNERFAERATFNEFRGSEFTPGLPRQVRLGVQYTL